MRQVRVSISGDDVGCDDEAIAYRHSAALLISGPTAADIERAARRIHTAQFGQSAPFVILSARMFARHSGRLTRQLAAPMGEADGGSLFVSDVEEMPVRAQDAFVRILTESFPPSVRLVTGTTVPLFDRVSAGQFAQDLFYRLNIIHLAIDHSPASV